MSVFHFQQFSVRQQDAAMKVCTDATLFGAMAPVAGGEKVLGIGTGTGLLALILAQMGVASVVAVELDSAACREAAFNFRRSPWNERLIPVQADIRRYAKNTAGEYDLIICNPPFFQAHSRSPDAARRLARHDDSLPRRDLLAVVNRLLAADGLFHLLLPVHAVESFVALADAAGLSLHCRTDIRGYARNNPKVAVLVFARRAGMAVQRTLTIYREERIYSPPSEYLLSRFLLRFAGVDRHRLQDC
jgi:tRNA1Val (adenine37-N6)-methyltransferase